MGWFMVGMILFLALNIAVSAYIREDPVEGLMAAVAAGFGYYVYYCEVA